MKKQTIVVCAIGGILGLLDVANARAQTPPAADAKAADVDKLVELVRKDVRAQKADIVAKTMALDASQAAAFWPVYKTYEAERQALGDKRVAVIKDLAAHFDTLTDARAKELLDRSFAIEEQKTALDKRYRDEFLKVLPAKTVARFFQVESRLDKLIDLKISSEIPLVN